ncbi:hypothetical protein O4328_36890 [Rhodococcus opacus]|uniref:Uncharacterized protein n=1 Tax=Rhodococcus opacus TaxID=37919 RepID=A0ABT4NP59_RHOOP|nr:hypothetical protein [Rhodococcus opacus]MCZ4589164.1 hypothetical protein [Rhodococcus opacus]
MTAHTGRPTSAGIHFDAVGGTPAYLSRSDHRRRARGSRNKWAIRPPEEYDVFAASYSGRWLCSDGHNWGVKEAFAVIGTKGERIAKFPQPSNPGDERHGYPVSARDRKRETEHRPPPSVTTQWLDQELISEFDKHRIDRCKI